VTVYGTTFGVHVDHDHCRIVVRFDKERGSLDRFAVQLQAQATPAWKTIAQIDHAPRDANGHDLYVEGLHVDIYRRNGEELKLYPAHTSLPSDPGKLLRVCTDYLKGNVGWFWKVHRGHIEPGGPPGM
jgi:hypothetical protein